MEINKYPVGKLEASREIPPAQRKTLISEIAAFPARLRAVARGCPAARLDAPYREGGWTLRQIIHHIADSTLNGFTRFKFALSQDNPALPAFDQDVWASMADAAKADIEPSLLIMDGLAPRLAALLSSLAPRDFTRTFQHPERGTITVDFYLQLMAWHCRHHAAQIEAAILGEKKA